MRLVYRAVALALAIAAAGCGQQNAKLQPSLNGESGQRVALAAEASGDVALAEQLLAQASAAEPGKAATQLQYADLLVRRGKIPEARDLLRDHLGKVSEPLLLHDGLGSIYVLAGEPEQAIHEFDQVLAVKPKDIRATVNKAVALDLLKRHDDAQALYRQALAQSPDDAVIINDLVLSHLLAGHPREAEQLANTLKDRPDIMPRVRGALGVVLAANGDLAGAQEVVGTDALSGQLQRLARAAAGIAQ